jgi:hypothetical protein
MTAAPASGNLISAWRYPGRSIADVTAVHPRSLNTLLTAAATVGVAAAQQDQQKRGVYARAGLLWRAMGT